jgi:hypothetical protein
MKMMIGRSEQGRALIKTTNDLNLQDLTTASDAQIAAVTNLAWEIKRLFYALISGKTSIDFDALNIGGDAKPDPALVADLTASLPRDVLVGAQRQWLPDLAAEIANGPIRSDQESNKSDPPNTESRPTVSAPPEVSSLSDGGQATLTRKQDPADSKVSNAVLRDPPACTLRIFGQCLVSNGSEGVSKAAKPDAENAPPDAEVPAAKKKSSAVELPPAMQAGLNGIGQIEPAKTTVGRDKQAIAANEEPPRKATGQSDDLLVLTDQEMREMEARTKNAGQLGLSDAPAGAAAKSDAAPRVQGSPAASIESEVDAESWAQYGGWYRQDDAIYYRPSGHKDKFIYAWLSLTGPKAAIGGTNPASAIFASLAGKDAQGACAKCHSIDDIQGGGRVVHFSPLSVAAKQGRFTNFIHEPHMSISGARGCLTCHALEKSGPYLKSYEQGNPQNFASNFSAVKKDLCQSCHASNLVRQDCLTCHTYHVNGVITPIINTKNPIQ